MITPLAATTKTYQNIKGCRKILALVTLLACPWRTLGQQDVEGTSGDTHTTPKPKYEYISFTSTEYKTVNGKDVPLEAVYEGGLRPDSFFLKFASHRIAYPRQPSGLESVCGASMNYWWHLDPGHRTMGLASRSKSLGGHPDNGREIFCGILWRRLLSIDNTLQVVEELNKQHQSNPLSSHSDKLMGGMRIGRLPSGQVNEIAWENESGTTTNAISVEYTNSIALCPSTITFESHLSTPRTNKIIKLTPTESGKSSGNYWSPKEFKKSELSFSTLIVWSNGAPFKISSTGEWIDQNISETVNPVQPNTVTIILALCGIWSISTCLGLQSRSQSKPTTK